MALNPLVFLLGGLALLVSTLTIAALNRRAVETENPYDTHTRTLDLAWGIAAIRHADVLYRTGLEHGRRFPHPSPDRVAASLERLGLGTVSVRRSAKRVEFHVHNGPATGAPQIGESLCHFTLGILRGAFEKDAEAGNIVEESCHGTGASVCAFSMEVKQVGKIRK